MHSSFLIALTCLTISLHAEVDVTSPRIEKALPLTLVGSVAETTRNYVHLVDWAGPALFTLDTGTGQFIAGTKLAGKPGHRADMSISQDGTRLFVPLEGSKTVQVISLADLSTLDVLHVGEGPITAATGAGDLLYLSTYAALNEIIEINSVTGERLSVIRALYGNYIKTDASGRRLFSIRINATGGAFMVTEYAVGGGEPPKTIAGYYSRGSDYDKDFEVDSERKKVFVTGGGTYGLQVIDLQNGTDSFWAYGEAYGKAVAHQPGSKFVFGASGSEPLIVRFDKETGAKSLSFPLGSGSSDWLLDRGLEVTPNGHIFYAKENKRVGLIGVGTMGELPQLSQSLDAGPDRKLADDEVLSLPQASWRKVKGLGNVGFTSWVDTIQAEFQYPGEYVLEGSLSFRGKVHRDLLRVSVPPKKKPYMDVGSRGNYKVPAGPADLTRNGISWAWPEFDDASWGRGQSGFGYDRRAEGFFTSAITTSIEASMYNQNRSVLVRMPFQFPAEAARIAAIELRMKIDDGFVAYLNGSEVARFNAGTNALTWNSGAIADNSDATALTFQAFDLSAFKTNIIMGTNVLAIHALNDEIGDEEMLVMPALLISVTETPYSAWTYEFPFFTGPIALPLADADKDGRPNFYEFATGGVPVYREPEEGIRKPKVTVVANGDQEMRLRVSYVRRRDAASDGVVYRTVFSPDLSERSWRYGGTFNYPTRIISLEPTEDEQFELVTEELQTDLADKPGMFVRVDVQFAPRPVSAIGRPAPK